MATETIRQTASPGTVLRGVDWRMYERLRGHPGNDSIRMSYLDGTLILMSPAYIHDYYGRRLAKVVDEVTEALGIFVQASSTTTLRRKGDGRRKGSGKEPDFGFYFRQNAIRMSRRDVLDLDLDPPPDLAIEVDHKADSTKALAIYARIGVPEVWRYRVKSQTLWFGRLVGDRYEPIERSLNLSRLTPALVLLALSKIDEMGETASKSWIRDWAWGLPEPVA